MEDKSKGLILVLLALLAFTASITAQNTSDVQSQLQVAQEAIDQMENEGVPTERAQSLLTTANNSFKAQQSLAEEGGKPDYSRTLELTDQILNMKETALRVNDRLNALENRIDELENNSNLNLTDVNTAYRDVNQTFNNQRFSEAENQVEQVYTEISEAQSVETQVQAFASAQQQNISGLIENSINYATENWLTLLIGGTVFGGILLIGGRELKLWRLKKKKESLLSEKQIVEKMVEEAQREYFVEGKGSKMSFETRMDKFKEMLRDTEESLNNVENEIERMEGLPVISPDIKARTEDFKEAGDVITESKEVKGSLDRIREQEEKEKEGADEKDIEVIEEKKDSGEKASDQETEEEEKSDEEKPVEVKDTKESEKVNEYVTLVNESTVKEAKARIEEIEDPDYKALMEAEKAKKDRVTLERFLEDKIEEHEAEEKEEDNSETETEEKPVEVIEDSEEVSEEENEDSESEKAIEENEDEKEAETGEESESQEVERPVEVKDTEDNEEQEDEPDEGDEEKIVDKGGKTVEEAGIEYVEADEDEEKDKEQESEEDKASAEETIEEELGKAFASVGNDDEEEGGYEDESEDLSEEKEVDEKQVSEEEKTTGESKQSEVSDEKPVEVKDTEEPSEEIVESSKETGSDEKESSEETEDSGEEDMDIIEEDGKYIDPETGKEFDTESAAKLFKQHFG